MTESQQQATKATAAQIPTAIQAAPLIPAVTDAPGDVAPTHSEQLAEHHADFAEFHEDYVSRYIELADTKASWAFAVASGALVYILGADVFKGLTATRWSYDFLLVAATITLLLLSALFSFLVLAPRSKSSGEGIVYFADVANRKSAAEYVKDIASRDEASLTEARLTHCYDIARICVRKYNSLRRAILLGVPGLVGLGLMLLLS